MRLTAQPDGEKSNGVFQLQAPCYWAETRQGAIGLKSPKWPHLRALYELPSFPARPSKRRRWTQTSKRERGQEGGGGGKGQASAASKRGRGAEVKVSKAVGLEPPLLHLLQAPESTPRLIAILASASVYLIIDARIGV